MMTVAALCAAATGTATKLKNTLQKDSSLVLADSDFAEVEVNPVTPQIKDLIMSGQQILRVPKTKKLKETNAS